MNLLDLRSALQQRPFKPFRLYVSEGETFDILHPELCMAGYTSVFIGFPSPEDADAAVYARWTIIDLAHVIRLEPLEAPAKKGA
jgi:hypothetical protein